MKPRFIIQLVLLTSFLALAHRSALAQHDIMLYPIVDGAKIWLHRRKRKVAISPQFDDAKLFYEGLARVRIGAKWGFIDKSGRLAIPARFEVNPYGETLTTAVLTSMKEWRPSR